MPIGETLSALVPFLATGLNVAGGLAGQNLSYGQQKRLADRQYGYNLNMMHYQNAYNSPQSQMERYRAAGLNPNLIYGQGTSGNMTSAPQYPDIQAPDYARVTGSVGTQLQQSKLMQEQASLVGAKTAESGMKQAVLGAQEQVLAANPLLNKSYFNSMVSILEATATLKKQEAVWSETKTIDPSSTAGEITLRPNGFIKLDQDLKNLVQKWNLGSADLKLKSEILQNREFTNDILKIQKEWLEDGDITWQHIYQGIFNIMGFFK